MTLILDGKKITLEVSQDLKKKVERLRVKPKLAVIEIGQNPTSLIFIKNKKEFSQKIGCHFQLFSLKRNISQEKLVKLIEKLNKNKIINGIIIQLPLPPHIKKEEVFSKIDPLKDIDDLGGKSHFLPAVSQAVLEILRYYKIPFLKKKIIIIGKGTFGKKIGELLVQKGGDVDFIGNENIEEAKKADILISVVGKPGLINSKIIKRGAVVIDVGTAFIKGKIKGDVNFEEIKEIASAITPTPGGIGPLTVVFLFKNLLKAIKKTKN